MSNKKEKIDKALKYLSKKKKEEERTYDLAEHEFALASEKKRMELLSFLIVKDVVEQPVGMRDFTAKPATQHYQNIDGTPDSPKVARDNYDNFTKSQLLRPTQIGFLSWL